MADRIAYEIINLKWLIISLSLFCIVFFIAMYFALKKFDWTKGKVRLFSIFYDLSPIDCVCFSLMLTRMVYVIYLSINNETISVEYLITLLVMSIVICILEKDYMSIITAVFTSVAIYVIIFLQSSLRYFYQYVEHDTSVLLMIIFLAIFTVLFAIYNLISSYNHMIVLHKKDNKKLESLESTNKIKWPKVKQNGKLKSSL